MSGSKQEIMINRKNLLHGETSLLYSALLSGEPERTAFNRQADN
jgi:hypothetical protein